MKNKIIAGNWKMNKTIAETKVLITELIPLVKNTQNTVVICVPYTNLSSAMELTRGTNIHVGAENVHFEEKGAYTGEISPLMLNELGVEYVVIGHSERRQYFNETDETVLKRAKAALAHNIKPIVCIGESLAERQNGKMEEVLKSQILKGFETITPTELANVIVAYEPIWAIGTGVTATNTEANDAIIFIRKVFNAMYGKVASEQLFIQYGGSMNEKNATELLSMSDIDGGLIGGASLVAEKFAAIVNAK